MLEDDEEDCDGMESGEVRVTHSGLKQVLPRYVKVAPGTKALVKSTSQVPWDKMFLKCSNCLGNGHLRFECSNDQKCYKCHRSGHVAQECVPCTFCKRFGHTEDVCRNKLKQKKEEQPSNEIKREEDTKKENEVIEKKDVDFDLKVGQVLGEQRIVIEKNREDDEDFNSSLLCNQQQFMKSTEHGQQDVDVKEQEEPTEQMEIGETNTNKRKLQFEETLGGSLVKKKTTKGKPNQSTIDNRKGVVQTSHTEKQK